MYPESGWWSVKCRGGVGRRKMKRKGEKKEEREKEEQRKINISF